MTTHFWAVPKIGTPAIQIDIDPEALGRNYPLQAARQRRRQGDAGAHAGGSPIAASAGKRKAWIAQAQGICKEWYAKYNAALKSDAVPIRPGAHLRASSPKHVPDDAIVVVDTGHAGMWMGGMYDLRSPHAELYAQRRPSRLGVSGRARRQMRRARTRPVVMFTGDAGFWYHIGEIETAVRWKINAVTVVNNNGGGNQSKRGFDRVYGGTQTEQARELWTYTQGQLRADRRGHGRARHPRREARGSRRRWRRRSPPTGRWSSTSSPTSTRSRRPR